MKKNLLYAESEAAKKVFLQKYGNIIQTISNMPNETKEEQEERYSYYKKHQTDDFLISLFKAVKPNEAARIDKHYDNIQDILPEEIEKVSQMFDYYLRGLEKQVKIFTGINNSGKECSFFQVIGNEIRHLSSKESHQNLMIKEKSRVSSSKQQRIRKLTKLLKEIQIISGTCTYDGLMKSAENLEASCFESELSTDDYSFAVEYVLGIGRFAEDTSLDAPFGEEADETLLDIIADKQNSVEDKLDVQNLEGHDLISLLRDKKQFEFLVDSKKDLFTGTKRSDWEWILWFTQINMLVALKLEKCETGKKSKDDVPVHQEPFNKVDGSRLFYYRYRQEPAGDEEVYYVLKPSGDIIYDNILDKRYLLKAFSEKRFPEDFYEVYVKLLEETFNFSNKIQAECLGVSESLISKKMTRYRKVLSPQLEKWLELL